MSAFKTLVSLALLVSTHLALVQASVYVTNPVQSTVCHAGQSCNVEWVDDGQSPLLSDIGECTVGLYNGEMLLAQSLTSVNVADTHSFSFTPSPSAGDNGGYYLVFTSTSNSYQSWSGTFNLDGMTGSSGSGSSSVAGSSTVGGSSTGLSTIGSSTSVANSTSTGGSGSGSVPTSSIHASSFTSSDTTHISPSSTPTAPSGASTLSAPSTLSSGTSTHSSSATSSATSATPSATQSGAAIRAGASTSLAGGLVLALAGALVF